MAVMWWWSYLLTAVGVTGLYLSGRKSRWGWAIGFAAQLLWVAYSTATHQSGFYVSAIAYGWVNARNFLRWRKPLKVRLEPGEYVLNAAAVGKPAEPLLDKMQQSVTRRSYLLDHNHNKPGCGWTDDAFTDPMVFCTGPAEWELKGYGVTCLACTPHKERALADWPDAAANAVVRRLDAQHHSHPEDGIAYPGCPPCEQFVARLRAFTER